MKIKSIGLATITLLCASTIAQAAVLFSDDFNRTGALNGSTTATGGLTWSSSNNNSTVTDDGGRTGGWNAKVAFTPESGKLYLLTVTTTSTIQNALELGFGNSGSSFFGGDFDGLIQKVGNMQTARIGPDADYNTFGPTVSGTRSHSSYTLDSGTGNGFVNTLTLLLDTTSGLATSQMTWSINGVQKGTWSADVTGYNSVMFGRGRFGGEGGSDPTGNNTVSNIQLEVIPEPTTALLGGIGMLCLLRRRRSA